MMIWDIDMAFRAYVGSWVISGRLMIKYSFAFMELGLLRPFVHRERMYFSNGHILNPFLAVTRDIPRYRRTTQPSRINPEPE